MLPYSLNVDILISGVLFLIMFGIGLSLTFSNYKTLFLNPKPIIVGLVAQMILLPLMVAIIVAFTNIPPAIKVGFLVLSACPGGTTSGFITYLFKGDVALSISLVSINGLLTLITIPIIVNTGIFLFLGKTNATIIYLPYLNSIIQIAVVTIIPATLGMLVRMKNGAFATKVKEPLRWILFLLLGFVFIIKLFAKKNEGGTGIDLADVATILPIAVLINVCAFTLGYLFAIKCRLDKRRAFTVGIEVTMQNTSLAFLITGTLMANQEMLKPALVYALFSFWTAMLFAYFTKKRLGLKLFDEFGK